MITGEDGGAGEDGGDLARREGIWRVVGEQGRWAENVEEGGDREWVEAVWRGDGVDGNEEPVWWGRWGERTKGKGGDWNSGLEGRRTLETGMLVETVGGRRTRVAGSKKCVFLWKPLETVWQPFWKLLCFCGNRWKP